MPVGTTLRARQFLSCHFRARRRKRRYTGLRVHRFEVLEDRRLLAVFVVNSSGDADDSGAVPGVCDTALDPTADPPVPASGLCTLRAAITSGNLNPGPDTIQFALPDGAQIFTEDNFDVSDTITIEGPPERVVVSGAANNRGGFRLEPGAAGSSIRNLVLHGFQDAILVAAENVTITGNVIGLNAAADTIVGNAVGIRVLTANNQIGGPAAEDRNIISGNTEGVLIGRDGGDNPSQNRIEGNYIGTDGTGTAALGNAVSGVRIIQSSNNVIGGVAGRGNVISGNQWGILIEGSESSGNLIAGNLIGTTAAGDAALGNAEGIFLFGAPENQIGGTPSGTSEVIGNVISGSTGEVSAGLSGMGVRIAGVSATGNVIQGNRIGTNAAGSTELGNRGDGVHIAGASSNVVGGTSAAQRNVISGNDGDGILLGSPSSTAPADNNHVLGNYIGVDVTGSQGLGNGFRGVHIDSHARNNRIGFASAAGRNVISANRLDGVIIALAGATGNVIEGNFIGTDSTGQNALGNLRSGVFLLSASENVVGRAGDTSFARNVISGNLNGVRIQGPNATQNVVEGNLIGTNAEGTEALGNVENGVYVLNAVENRIGSQTPQAPDHPNFRGNVISANDTGVRIEGGGSEQNQVEGNLIGTTATGDAPLGNDEAGVHLVNASNNRIGAQRSAPAPAPQFVGNTIASNEYGILIEGVDAFGNQIGGNLIGTDYRGQFVGSLGNILANVFDGIRIDGGHDNFIGGDPGFFIGELPPNGTSLPGNLIAGNNFAGVRILGDSATGNRVRQNSIHDNGALGIDLALQGVTANDLLDADEGPNGQQNFPVLLSIDPDGTVHGRLESTPLTTYAIDVYFNQAVDPSGHGEGQVFAATASVTTDADGVGTFSIATPFDDMSPPVITATATSPTGDTSEFSGPLALADLTLGPLVISHSSIQRRGDEYFLPIAIEVKNEGVVRAENFAVRFLDGGDAIFSPFDRLTLDPGASFLMEKEWNITSAFHEAIPGVALLDLRITVDPSNEIPEVPRDNNHREATLTIDARPRIEQVRTTYRPGIFLAGVDLLNSIDVNVDWNGDLDDALAAVDEGFRLFTDLAGQAGEVVPTSLSPLEPIAVSFNLGDDLQVGTNLVRFRAESALHSFASAFETLQFDQHNLPPWFGSTLVSVSDEPAGASYDKIAVYKAGIVFPEIATEGFFGIPVDKISLLAGKFGPQDLQTTLRTTFRSDTSSRIDGQFKIGMQLGDKDVGGARGDIVFTVRGTLIPEGDDVVIETLEGLLRFQGAVISPRVPLPAPASFIRGQAKTTVGIDTLIGVDDPDGELDWRNFVLGVDLTGEGALIASAQKVASVEVGLGASGRGEFQFPTEPCLLKSLSVDLIARLKAQFLAFEAEKTFRFPFASTGCGGPAGEADTAGILLSESLKLATPYPRTAGEPEPGGLPVIENPHAQPALAHGSDGRMTLVWIDKDPLKPAGAQLEVMAATHDGETWSAPVMLTDDLLLDSTPRVVYDAADRPVVVWSRLKNVVANPDTTDPHTLLGDLELAYATYDELAGTWSAPAVLSDNAVMDFSPNVAAGPSGVVTAMWLQDSDNAAPLFPGDEAPLGATLLQATWDGAAWSNPEVALTDLPTDARPQFALGATNSVFVYSHDSDGDANTDADRDIRVAVWNGVAWSEPVGLHEPDDLADDAPQITRVDDTLHILWVKAAVPDTSAPSSVRDQLYWSTYDGHAFSAPIVAAEAAAILEPRVVVDGLGNLAVVWQGQSEAGSDIYFAYHDTDSDTWSQPQQFTDDDSVEWELNPYVDVGGELQVLYLSRSVQFEPVDVGDGSGGEAEPTVLVPALAASQLVQQSAQLVADLKAEQLLVSSDSLQPGGMVTLTAWVSNPGVVTAAPVHVVFHRGQIELAEFTFVAGLAPGATVPVELLTQIPITAEPVAYSFTVDPLGTISEADETNNSASATVLQADLALEDVISHRIGELVRVQATVRNRGFSLVNAPFEVVLRRGDPSTGNVLASTVISEALEPGAAYQVELFVPVATLPADHVLTGWLVIDPPGALGEGDVENNSAAILINPFTSWQNPQLAEDVNASGSVTVRDVRVLLSRFLSTGAERLPAIPRPAPFYDVNGDARLTVRDIVETIRQLVGQVESTEAEAGEQLARTGDEQSEHGAAGQARSPFPCDLVFAMPSDYLPRPRRILDREAAERVAQARRAWEWHTATDLAVPAMLAEGPDFAGD